MKPMRAIRASKWQLSVANGFALLRERYLEIDTIPKPCGLGSEGPLSGLYVPVLSGICPTFVRLLSRFCAASFCAPEDPWKTNFSDVLSSVDAKQGRSRLEPYGELWTSCGASGFTCRDITAPTSGEVSVSNFEKCSQTISCEREHEDGGMPPAKFLATKRYRPRSLAKRAGLHSGPGPSENEVQQRIAAMKARKPATVSSDNDFYFDPTEPLRLIDPGKRDSND